jgi:hypothetical protein
MASAFYGPRSRENARLLIDAANTLGIPVREVRTQNGGYSVPVEIVDYINRDLDNEDAEDKGGTEAGGVPGDTDTKRPSQADSKADWLAYAESKSLDVTDENTKAEIVEAVKKAEEETD